MRQLALIAVFLGCGEVKVNDEVDAPPGVEPDGPPAGAPPVVDSIDLGASAIIDVGQTQPITCNATDPDGDTLTFTWSTTLGNVVGEGASVGFDARGTDGEATITCTVDDGKGNRASRMATMTISLPRQQLAAYYSFTGNGGDDSGNGLGANITTFGPDRRGNANGALRMVAGQAAPQLPASTAFDATGDFTMAMFVSLDNVTSNRSIIGKGPNFGNYTLQTNAAQNRVFLVYQTVTGGNFSAIAASAIPSTPTHLAVVFTANQLQTFVDGQLASSVANPPARVANQRVVLLGGTEVAPSENLIGTLDEVRFYRRALTALEINALAKSTLH